MRHCFLRTIALLLAAAAVWSCLFIGAAEERAFGEEVGYFYHGKSYICDAYAVRQGRKDLYTITFDFASIPEPVTAKLGSRNFLLDNAQPAMDHIYRQEIWSVFAGIFLDLYRFAYGEDMPNRTLDGAVRELLMHYWMYQTAETLLGMLKPIVWIAEKTQFSPFVKIVNLLNNLHFRAKVTDLGADDGHTDTNCYVFEQANSGLQSLFYYGRDFFSLGFMGKLADLTDHVPPRVMAGVDQMLFRPRMWEKLAEIRDSKKQ